MKPLLPLLAAPTLDPTPPAATDLEDLLARQDLGFMRAAYVALLGRDADEDGLAHYLVRLRNGRSKMRIVRELCDSSEGREYDSALPGLRAALRRQMLAQLPWVGAVLGRLLGLEGEGSRDRQQRAALAQAAQILEELRLVRALAVRTPAGEAQTLQEPSTDDIALREARQPREVQQMLQRLRTAVAPRTGEAHAFAD